MSKEYVERELAIGAVEYVANKDTRIYSSENKYSEIIQALSEAPAADVEPVRHGEWLEHDYEHYIKSDNTADIRPILYRCSLCGRVEVVKEPYCNCGARMDGATPFEEIKMGLQQAINYEKDISNGGNSDA